MVFIQISRGEDTWLWLKFVEVALPMSPEEQLQAEFLVCVCARATAKGRNGKLQE